MHGNTGQEFPIRLRLRHQLTTVANFWMWAESDIPARPQSPAYLRVGSTSSLKANAKLNTHTQMNRNLMPFGKFGKLDSLNAEKEVCQPVVLPLILIPRILLNSAETTLGHSGTRHTARDNASQKPTLHRVNKRNRAPTNPED